MMSDPKESDVIEKIEFLVRSYSRVKILDTLAEHGRLDRATLKDRLDIPNSTLQRNLRLLEEEEWIRRKRSECEITTLGKMVAMAFDEIVETMRLNAKLKPAMEWLPADALDINLRKFADASVTLSTPDDPYAPVNKHIDGLRTAEVVKVVLPSLSTQALRIGQDRVMGKGEGIQESEIVIEREVAKTLRANRDYEQMFEEMVATGRMEVYVYEDHLPFYLGLLDDTVQIGVEDTSGIQRALIEVDNPEVRAWAEDTFETIKRDSIKISQEKYIDMDRYVPMYDECFYISPTGVPTSLRTLVELAERYAAPSRPSFRIADIGCGTGRLTAAVAETYTHAAVVGIDKAEPAVKRARDRTSLLGNVDIVNGTPESISAGAIDFLYAINVVNDTQAPKAMVARLYDVLRDGGTAIITVPTAGAEKLFVTSARDEEHVTLRETDDEIQLESDKGTILIKQMDGMMQFSAEVNLTDRDVPVETLTTSQFMFEQEMFEAFCEDSGFVIHEINEIVCDPSGVPAIMEINGFSKAVDRWQQVVETYKTDPDRVRDRLPTVTCFHLEK